MLLFTRRTSRPQQTRQSRAQPRGPPCPRCPNLRNISPVLGELACRPTDMLVHHFRKQNKLLLLDGVSQEVLHAHPEFLNDRPRPSSSLLAQPRLRLPPSLWIVSNNFHHQIQHRIRCGFERLPVDLFELLHYIYIDGDVEHFKLFPRETSTQVKTTRLLCSCLLCCRCGFARPSELCTPPNEFPHRHQTCCTSITPRRSLCLWVPHGSQVSATCQVQSGTSCSRILFFAISANTARHTCTRRLRITRKILIRYKFSRQKIL